MAIEKHYRKEGNKGLTCNAYTSSHMLLLLQFIVHPSFISGASITISEITSVC